MGVFSRIAIRAGFATVFRPSSSILPATRDQLTKNSPVETTLTTGTGTDQCDLEYNSTQILTASSNLDYDVRGGLTDAFGATINFVKIKGIYIKAAYGNTNSVVVKPGASNGFTGPFGAATHTITIPPGGLFMVTAPKSGWSVTAGTGDLINIANSSSGSSVTFDLHIIGTSA